MNIFVLDYKPELAALYHCDKHVVKMITEYAQLMCTVHRLSGTDNQYLYRSTHIRHPCTLWLLKSQANYRWLYELYTHTAHQYQARYGKIHAAYSNLYEYLQDPPDGIPDIDITPFAQAMPDIYKQSDAVEAYRAYYRGEKAKFARWMHPSSIPCWFIKE